jgi:hypothetical protein
MPQVRKVFCAQCGGARNCDVRAHWALKGEDQDVSWQTDWYVLQCQGCEYVFAQTVETNSEDYEEYYDDEFNSEARRYKEKVAFWPALAKRKKPDWLAGNLVNKIQLNDRLEDQLEELYKALDNDLNGLAATGIRTCFDVSAELLGAGAGDSFEKKLKFLVDNGHIGALDKDRLATAIDAGSASAHRGWRPTTSELDGLMSILEHFIEHAFIGPAVKKGLDAQASKIKARVPPRPAPPKKGKPQKKQRWP